MHPPALFFFIIIHFKSYVFTQTLHFDFFNFDIKKAETLKYVSARDNI